VVALRFLMVPGANPEISRVKDGRRWRIGGEDTVAWIQDGTEGGVAITSAVPPVFEAYATIVLPLGDETQDPEDAERQDPAMLAVLTEHTTPQPWWLGYLETGEYEIPFSDAPKVTLYAGWRCVLVEAGPDQAAAWRPRAVLEGRAARPDVPGRSLMACLNAVGR
jgi:hypothetical protein